MNVWLGKGRFAIQTDIDVAGRQKQFLGSSVVEQAAVNR